MNQELRNFIRESLEKGVEKAKILEALSRAGWEDDEAREGIAAFHETDFAVPVPVKKVSTQAREAFFYLVSFIGLYVSALATGTLIFSFIEFWFPDALRGYSLDSSLGSLRMAASSLFVAFPLFLLMSRNLLIASRKDPDRRSSPIGRWLTYITLVIASGVIIGDLIAILFNLLGGELTVRFALKAFSVLLIALAVFGYYLSLMRSEEKNPSRLVPDLHASKIFFGAVVALAGASFVYALVLIGTPSIQRARAFDNQRVGDLQQIASLVNNYADGAGKLPENLGALKNLFVTLPDSFTDPKTRQEYEYRATGETSYELCATFETNSRDSLSSIPTSLVQETWSHGTGRTCFEREVLRKIAPSPAPVPSAKR